VGALRFAGRACTAALATVLRAWPTGIGARCAVAAGGIAAAIRACIGPGGAAAVAAAMGTAVGATLAACVTATLAACVTATRAATIATWRTAIAARALGPGARARARAD
jgi:hypothetical protein